MKYLFREVDERAGTESDQVPLLSVSIHKGVVPRAEMTDRESRADNFSQYKRVRRGDVVINRMRAFEGGAGISRHDGMVSTDYAVLRTDSELHAAYLHHLIRSRWFVGEMTARLRGIGSADSGNVRTPRINVEDLGDIRVPLPTLREQLAIADYLDAEITRIDALTDRRRRIVGLLSERRRLSTDRALADLSSSGRDGWPLVKLKHVVRGFVDTLHATAPPEDAGAGYIVGTACIKDGALNLALAKRCSTETLREWTRRATPRPGDILLTREAPAGEAALVPDKVSLAAGQRVLLVQTDPDRMLPELVLFSIYSERARRFFERLSRETTVAHLNMADIGELPLVLPPHTNQVAVVESIRKSVTAIDRASAAMQRQIDLLLERRQALITAAVTGELEIPGAAA